MNDYYTTTGTISDKNTLILDGPIPLPVGRVRITVERIMPPPTGEHFLTKLHALQKSLRASGYQSRTKTEIDDYIQAERDSWGE